MPVPVDLNKLCAAAKYDIVKKAAYDKLAEKVSNIDISRFVVKTKYDTDKSDLENKIPHTSRLVKKADYNTKITKTENRRLSISGLAINSALTAVEDKIPNINSLVKNKQIITQKLLKLEKTT